MKNQTLSRYGLLLYLLTLLSSCDGFLDIVPAGDVIPETEKEYRATLNSGYASQPNNLLINLRGLVYDHEADPLGFNLDAYEIYKSIHSWADEEDNSGRSVQYPYDSFYKGIFYANSIILTDPSSVKDDDPDDSFDQILSEAYALRAFNYFSLLNLYAPKWSEAEKETPVVPLNNTIDTEQTFPRSSMGKIYEIILSDLTKAEELSRVSRYESPRYRYRLSKEAIHALTSRVRLYRGEWSLALAEARKALKVSDTLTDLNTLSKEGFLPTDFRSPECIAAFSKQQESGIGSYLSIQKPLLDLYKDGDLRREKYYKLPKPEDKDGYAVMAKVGTPSTSVTFRRAEIYLTAAEAATRLGETEEGKTLLTTLLKSRLTPEVFRTEKARIDQLTGDKLLEEILLQRRLELSGEGHDWLDFKRTTQPELHKVVRGVSLTLPAGDPRYVITLPKDARDNNPLL